MEEFVDVLSGPGIALWGEAVRAWRLDGERITLSVVELDPGAALPEHAHEAEQVGICLRGNIEFDIDGRVRDVAPGGGWRIATMRPHRATAGPEGATVVEVFSPIRKDWDGLPAAAEPARPPSWR